jgi:hypothetical protein
MRAWLLAAALAAGCGPVRMDAVRKESGGAQRLYTRDDPDGRTAALESAGDEACREARRGRWMLALCAEPENLRAGAPALLRFQAGEETAQGPRPTSGAMIAVALRHLGGRTAPLTHAEPSVSSVRETSPGNYEATAVFPAEGRWTVDAAVTLPNDETVRLKFKVTVAPAAPRREPAN